MIDKNDLSIHRFQFGVPIMIATAIAMQRGGKLAHSCVCRSSNIVVIHLLDNYISTTNRSIYCNANSGSLWWFF